MKEEHQLDALQPASFELELPPPLLLLSLKEKGSIPMLRMRRGCLRGSASPRRRGYRGASEPGRGSGTCRSRGCRRDHPTSCLWCRTVVVGTATISPASTAPCLACSPIPMLSEVRAPSELCRGAHLPFVHVWGVCKRWFRLVGRMRSRPNRPSRAPESAVSALPGGVRGGQEVAPAAYGSGRRFARSPQMHQASVHPGGACAT